MRERSQTQKDNFFVFSSFTFRIFYPPDDVWIATDFRVVVKKKKKVENAKTRRSHHISRFRLGGAKMRRQGK